MFPFQALMYSLQTPITLRYADLPVNWALLSILDVNRPVDTCRMSDFDEGFLRAEAILIRMSSYLRKADSERGSLLLSFYEAFKSISSGGNNFLREFCSERDGEGNRPLPGNVYWKTR